MELNGKKAIIIGTGKSGIAAAELLTKNKVPFVLYDANEKLKAEDIKAKSELLNDAEIVLGKLSEEAYKDFSYAVLSPGVPTDSEMVLKLKAAGAKISGEIELAYEFASGDVIAITGTNGKTTTTTLVGEIMKAYKADARVVGNIGIPYTSMVDDMSMDTVTVAEISSFQLETIHTFAPKVSAILNITPDHLNRHHTMENYILAKERVTENQSGEDYCVLNYEDEVLRKFGEGLKNVKPFYFSSATKLSEGVYYDPADENIYAAKDGQTRVLLNVNEQSLLGVHNYENICAACAMSICYGVPDEVFVEVVKKFVAVEHRIEYTCEVDGVRYYNDSKGTNPDAAIKGILAMNRPTVLIGGGYDKQSTYEEWINSFGGKVKKLVLIGETKQKIADTCDKLGFKDYCFAESLKEAMDISRSVAESGDAVLLSPACASWDMFESYEQRGRMFKDMARSFINA